MFFSIVTPVFNGETFVDGYFQCLKNQDFSDWESIIVDDSSTDNSFERIKRLTDCDPRYTVLKNSSGSKKKIPGPYQARNLALKKATGKFICFLDIDDSWPSNKLSNYHSILTNNSDIDLIYSDYICRDAENNTIFHVRQPPNINPKIIIHFFNPVPMLPSCIRSTLASSYSFSAVNHEDYLYWRSIVLRIHRSKIYHVPEPLAIYRIHNSSLTSNKLLSFVWLCKAYNFAGVKYFYIPFYLLCNLVFRFIRLIYSRFFFLSNKF